MRKINLFIIISGIILFLIHGIMASFGLFGVRTDGLKIVARAAATLITVHAVISTILTIETLRVRRKSGAGYFKGNGLFWARRLTGFTVLIPLIMHLTIFMNYTGEAYRLKEFNTGRMISQLLLIITMLLHILLNLNPVLIAFGVKGRKGLKADLCVFLSVMLFIFAAAFFVYYLRWIRI